MTEDIKEYLDRHYPKSKKADDKIVIELVPKFPKLGYEAITRAVKEWRLSSASVEENEEAQFSRLIEHAQKYVAPYLRVYCYEKDHDYYLLKDGDWNTWQQCNDSFQHVRKIYQILQDEGWPVVKESYVKQMIQHWLYQREAAWYEPPKGFCNHLEEDPCLARMKIAPAPGNCPTWDQWGETVNDYTAFKAYIWATILGKKVYKGRQNLWLWGPEGEDGKTTIYKVLGDYVFGEAFAIVDKHTEGRFAAVDYEFARVIMNGDSNNRAELLSGFIKGLTGSDKQRLEAKGKQGRFAYIQAFLWIGSNWEPLVLDLRHSISRLLLLTVRPTRKIPEEERQTFEPNLIEELPAFLAECEKAYEERCPSNYEIQTNDLVKAHVERLIGESSAPMADLLDKMKLEFDSEGSILSTELSKIRDTTLKINSSSKEWRDFVTYIKSKGCHHGTLGKQRVWKGIRRKSKSFK